MIPVTRRFPVSSIARRPAHRGFPLRRARLGLLRERSFRLWDAEGSMPPGCARPTRWRARRRRAVRLETVQSRLSLLSAQTLRDSQ